MKKDLTSKNNVADAQIICRLGGSTVVAKQLGYDVQRVQNWKTRGIPAKEKLKHPEMFLTQGFMAHA
jgi:hypothetical protein